MQQTPLACVLKQRSPNETCSNSRGNRSSPSKLRVAAGAGEAAWEGSGALGETLLLHSHVLAHQACL